MQVPGTALLVEDDPGVAATLRSHLTRAGFTVYEARSERDAVRRVEETAPDVVILDLALENGGGTGACRRIRELPSVGDVPLLVLSAESDVTAVRVARRRRKIVAAGGGVEIRAVRRSGYVLRPMTVTAVASAS